MKLVYPTFIKSDGKNDLVFVPDLMIYTFGKDFYDAIDMARDAIGLKIVTIEDMKQEIPMPSDSARAIELARRDADKDFDFSDGVLTFVDIDTKGYRARLNNKSVKKNCTIPAWLNEKAEERGINFSRVLQEALLNIIGAE